MKYAAALLTLAIASPALAQTNAVQSDRNQFNALICDMRQICDEAGQDEAWAAANASRELGAVGPVKGRPITTLSALGTSNVTSKAPAPRTNNSAATRAPAQRTIRRRAPVAPLAAVVTDEVKGESPLMVTFATNSARLTNEGRVAVLSFADLIRVDAAMGKLDSRFLIEGHTDSVGAEDFNQELSQKRAQAVVDALVDMGFEAERFIVEGKGETQPLEGRRGRDPLNRRVIAKAID